ncbi:MAG: flagellar basal-body rod protein FlgF [Pseudomonadota bacterium]|nr:flagellar basal-body rod protein FlgF [Pseudomonadota bacterium]
MENTTYVALNRQLALRRQMEIVANNMANVDTPAFKSEKLIFIKHLINESKNHNAEKISFSLDLGTKRDTTEGPLLKTDNPLDLGISGDGYFKIETPLGERYTRHGRFQLDAENQISTHQGDLLLDAGGNPIKIPINSKVEINPDGTVSTENGIIAKIGLVAFDDEQELKRSANNLYIAAEDLEQQEVKKPKIVQGMLEQSNVNAIEQFTEMIRVHRSNNTLDRSLKQEHERVMKMINRLARPSPAS